MNEGVTLEQMLAARDRRARIQEEMLAGGGPGRCLVCLTLNIAGDIKRTPMTRMLFNRGCDEMGALGFNVIEYREADEPTGSEGYWLLDEEASEVKRLLERVEDDGRIAASRLFDFDVLIPGEAAGGSFAPAKLSREGSRKCLLCERPAAECARSRRHGLAAVKAETDRLLREFCSDEIARAARDALLSELEVTPKPGLVDLNNNGAHSDMNPELFRRSAEALLPYFKDAALLGMKGCGMSELRERGFKAERDMLDATGGVNTHKGLIYSMGLLTAGMGMRLIFGGDYIRHAAGLAAEDAEAELTREQNRPSTNGGEVYKNYGARGARGHAAAGFPNAIYCAERLRCYGEHHDKNTSGVLALIDSIARLEDTNLLHRGGREGLEFAQRYASEIAELPEEERLSAAEKMDAEMIERNLSPGGSADMLALAYLMDDLREMLRQ